MILSALATIVLASVLPYQAGTFALLGGSPQIVAKFWATQGAGTSYTLNARQFAKSGTPIRAYDIDMQHYMHVVIVRDDFREFAHKHPSYNAGTGTFETSFTKQPNHKYYVYADSMPHGIGQQVFRFTIENDGTPAAVKPPSTASGPNSKAGPYTITLAKTTLRANAPQNVDLTVENDDDPADDLVPYLGAPAHVVLINVKTLDYVHAHPLLRGQTSSQMSSANEMKEMVGSNKAGPFMKLMLPALPPGVYAAWVQVAGGKERTVYTAPFTIVAR
jgi:hypothetical protein